MGVGGFPASCSGLDQMAPEVPSTLGFYDSMWVWGCLPNSAPMLGPEEWLLSGHLEHSKGGQDPMHLAQPPDTSERDSLASLHQCQTGKPCKRPKCWSLHLLLSVG